VSHAAIREFSIEMNSVVVLQLAGDALDMFDDVYQNAQQDHAEVSRYGDDKMARWRASRKPQEDWIRIRQPWDHPTSRLPVNSIAFTRIRARLVGEDLSRLVDSSDGSMPWLLDANRELKPEDIKINLYVDFYWVTDAERSIIMKSEHSFVIEQIQHIREEIIPKQSLESGGNHKVKLELQHPIKEIIFAYQPQSQVLEKNYFRYENQDGSFPIAKADLLINGARLHSLRNFSYYRGAELGRFHKKVPTKGFGGIVLSEFPENPVQPSGYLNPSAVRDITLEIELAPGTEQGILHIWPITYNIMNVTRKICKINWLNNA